MRDQRAEGASAKGRSSTIGLEKRQNPSISNLDRDAFIELKMKEKIERPWYFTRMEEVNTIGQPVMGRPPRPPPLSPNEFNDVMSSGALVVDTRSPTSFASAHIKGSFNIFLDILPNFAGWVLPYDRPILLLLESIRDLDVAVRSLIREGYDDLAGYLAGGIETWYDQPLEIERLDLMTASDLVRNPPLEGDVDTGHPDRKGMEHLQGQGSKTYFRRSS